MKKDKLKLKQNPYSREIAKRFEVLIDVMYTLRSEEGCPWDRAQTYQDLRKYLLEETYELLQTLDESNETGMKEELGDLLLQVVFLSQIMQEKGTFSLIEVLDRLNEKLVGRHAHVFGDVKAGTPDEAVGSWEAIKNREKATRTGASRSILDGVPPALPALLQAHLISTKVTRIGFDWETEQDVWKKLHEEIDEFKESRTLLEKEDEMGDILFTIVNIARKNEVNCEDALRRANLKFRDRFMKMEKQVYSRNKELSDLTLQELDEIWEDVKKLKPSGKVE